MGKVKMSLMKTMSQIKDVKRNYLRHQSSKGEKQFFPIGGEASEKKAVSSLFPPTKHGVLSSGGEDEHVALDQIRVNSFKEGQDADHHQGTNGFYMYSIGGEEKTTALDVD